MVVLYHSVAVSYVENIPEAESCSYGESRFPDGLTVLSSYVFLRE